MKKAIVREGNNATLACERLDDKGEINIIVCSGSLVLETQGPIKKLVEHIFQNRNGNTNHLILDLTDLTYLHPDGMGDILYARRKYAKINGRIVIVNLQSRVKKTYEIMGLENFLPAYNTINDALASFQD